jgi:hypothetical protein
MNSYSPESLRYEPNGFRSRALIIGVVCLGVTLIEFFLNPVQFFRSYLFGLVFWLGIGLSTMGLLMLHHLVSGRWGFVLRRSLEAGARTLVRMAPFFIVVLVGMRRLYIWSHASAVAASPMLQQKHFYLNTPFFIIRQIVYFAAWIIIAQLLTRFSARQDETGDPDLVRRMRNVSGPGMAIFGFTVTFAGFDWVMSLDPSFFSTIYGLIFTITEAVGGMAFVTLVAYYLSKREPISDIIKPSQFHDFGNLLLVFTLLWAYLSFVQFLIIWSGNLQNEIPWYVSRINRNWAGIALALVVFHFAVPFLLLLQRFITFRKQYLAGVAALLFLMSIIDLFWIMVPAYEKAGPQFHWSDWLALIGLGGIFLAIYVSQLKRKPLMPLHDPNFAGVLLHE